MNKATQAEQYLLDNIRRGDEQAWSQFVDRYRGRLLSFAQARSLQRADAEDVVQDTFVGFVRGLKSYRGDCDLETYLFTLIRRKVIDIYRTRQATHVCLIQDVYRPPRSGNQTQGDGIPSDPFSEITGPAQTASWYVRADEQYNLRRAALADALAGLVNGLRKSLNFRDLQITELLFYCHLSNKDVAKIMNLTENAVALVKHRSLKHVRKHVARLNLSIEPSSVDPREAARATPWTGSDPPSAGFEDLLTDVWECQRLSCPKRSTIGAYLLKTLEPPWHEYVDFHLNILGCRFCCANLEDLRAQSAKNHGKHLRARIMESTIGFLTKLR